MLIQLRFDKVLKGTISNMDNEKWERLNFRASSTICLSLAKNILANVFCTSSSKEFREKLKGIYLEKGILNRLLLKE